MRLSQTNYLKLCTMLPVVMPIGIVVLALFASLLGLRMPGAVEELFEYPVAGIMFFGPVYIAVVIPVLAFLRGRSLRFHIAAAIAAPLLMASLLEIGDVIVLRDSPGGGLLFVKIVLAVGYVYVGIALAGLWIGSRLGWFLRSRAT